MEGASPNRVEFDQGGTRRFRGRLILALAILGGIVAVVFVLPVPHVANFTAGPQCPGWNVGIGNQFPTFYAPRGSQITGVWSTNDSRAIHLQVHPVGSTGDIVNVSASSGSFSFAGAGISYMVVSSGQCPETYALRVVVYAPLSSCTFESCPPIGWP